MPADDNGVCHAILLACAPHARSVHGVGLACSLTPPTLQGPDHASDGPICVARHAQRRRTVFAHSDRKSTRLNSSHVRISYAVFCLKKKKKNNNPYNNPHLQTLL